MPQTIEVEKGQIWQDNHVNRRNRQFKVEAILDNTDEALVKSVTGTSRPKFTKIKLKRFTPRYYSLVGDGDGDGGNQPAATQKTLTKFILRFCSTDEQKSFAKKLQAKGVEYELTEFLPDIIVELDEQEDSDLREWIENEMSASTRLLPDFKMQPMRNGNVADSVMTTSSIGINVTPDDSPLLMACKTKMPNVTWEEKVPNVVEATEGSFNIVIRNFRDDSYDIKLRLDGVILDTWVANHVDLSTVLECLLDGVRETADSINKFL